ncbi:uncharacterized protein PFL1_01030 [Pseudozyma flocculosa PF-1]|uniref:VTT domain-containing protein n=1 Tax=Pseudozyma flocculosa TaxID=84751 RepID=A0A5C3F8L7_9BASI|nr:uncharacterized protein PFL1_01030 [Pseudozyma flocculosa PF-1]EPQ31697.1 hypothetical protein PFL1_01030 [Pseudozyma flocculosa PF-1]SPO40814.1 uncharacterized protein PSFLO_06296 [Pseudozyma flocculosa]
MASSPPPQSPPRLQRAMTEHPSPGREGSAARLASHASIEDIMGHEGPLSQRLPDGSDAQASSAALRRDPFAATTSGPRSRARSISSNGVSLIAVPSSLGVTPLSPVVDDFLHHPFRGPGTPDFTLTTGKRNDHDRSRTMASLGQGLEVLSNVERSGFGGAYQDDSNAASGSRPRSPSDASDAQSDDSTDKKRAMPRNQFLQRPKLAGLRSFISSFTSGANQDGSPAQTPQDEMPAAKPTFPAWQAKVRPAQPQPLVMPAARPAGPDGLRGFNADSPPLTPTSDLDEAPNYEQSGKLPSIVTPRQARHHGASRHPWSAAQASFDSGRPTTTTPPYPNQAPFTPPLTTSSGRSSPIASSRPFSPPTRPESTLNMQGVLPSHLMSGFSSRPPTPTSTHTTSSERSFGRIGAAKWDSDSFRIDSLGRTLAALLPRIQINMSSWRISLPPIRPYLPRLAFLAVIFVAATSCIAFMISTLPLTLPKHITSLTLAEIRDIAFSLKRYSESSAKAHTHTLLVISALFTWKQSFTIPGSLIMNVVYGAMYGTYMGTVYTSIFTAVGGVFCYLLSAPLAPLITSLPGLAKPLDAMRRALSPGRAHASGRSVMISNSRGSADGAVWSYLLVLRVLPIIPYGLMNIACGVLGVPLLPYGVTLAVGSIPWNFVTCQVGDLLQEIVEALPVDDGSGLKSGGGGGMKAIASHIWNRDMVIKLLLLSIASLIPMALSRYLKHRQRQEAAENEGYEPLSTAEEDELASRRSDEENDHSGSRRSSRIMAMQQRSPTTSATAMPASSSGADWYSTGNHLTVERAGHAREGTDASTAAKSMWL